MTTGNWNNREIWEERYSKGQALNKYPYEKVISFVMRTFSRTDRSKIKILDYGCGGGAHSLFLTNEGFDTYGMDYSFSSIYHTRRLLESSGQTGKQNLICGDFEALPYPDNYFDAIIDRQSLDQNTGHKIPLLVSEIYRVLKPSGKYWGINFCDRHPALKFGQHLGNGDWGDFTAGPFKGIGKRHFFSEKEIKDLFKQFKIEDISLVSTQSLAAPDKGSCEYVVLASKSDTR